MKENNNYLDKRGGFAAPPEGAANYPEKPEHRKIDSKIKGNDLSVFYF